MNHIQDTTTLHNGVKMPLLGLGVYKTQEGEETIRSVTSAIECGYRHIDTASLYANEAGVGKAIRESGIPREEIFVTTKVWNDDQGYESTLRAFEKSLSLLQMDYVDLYLVHWAVSGRYLDTWRALETLYADGRVRAIGVSNFQIHHLQQVLEQGEIKPMVNQVEYHPWLTQVELHAFCKQHQIQLEAWSPLARGQLLDHPILQQIANQYDKTTAQIILRWDLQQGVVTIPKSIHPELICSNTEIFDFVLTPGEIELISSINENKRVGRDPDSF